MPKTRQQTTPQQAPTRAAKRPRDETDAPAVSASDSKRPTVARRRSAAETGTSKQKMLAEQAAQAQQAVPAGVNDKENTPSVPRRSTRARTARIVQEVPPGPGLTRSARKQGSSIGRGASSSTPRKGRQTSAGKQSAAAKQVQTEAAAAEFASHSRKGIDPAMTSPQPTASALKPDGTPLQELPTELVPIQTPEGGLPAVSSSSSQEQPSANHQLPLLCQSPEHTVSLPPPCMHPSQPGLASIHPQQPPSPFHSGSPAAAAVAATGLAPAPAPSSAATVAMLVTDPDPVGNHSSQEGSRHSSGQSNDHPTTVMARKHLNWDCTGPPRSGPSSGPTSAATKPPLNKGTGTQAAQAGTSVPPAADGDDTWWDPTDSHKVLPVVLH